ncbi:LytR C-terminal domain-containing protein [Kitasatospora fiedleri]|uniref:LytR C-terminal domain-containing protein n=1 Tax=Kitasatospora fiedleri TaxID=2991545 RepID=UPI002989DEA0|nr:LytR C-terminal domain-containing protein [Kitasatospora fiedleri]
MGPGRRRHQGADRRRRDRQRQQAEGPGARHLPGRHQEHHLHHGAGARRPDGQQPAGPQAERRPAAVRHDRRGPLADRRPAAERRPEPAAPASSAPAAPQVDAADVKVTVRNGSGTAGQASKAATALQAGGFELAVAGSNADAAASSAVTYPAGHEDEARAVAAALGLPATAVQAGSRLGAKDGVVVVLGKDFTGAGSTASAAPTEAPKDIQRVQADDTNVCAAKAK